MIDLIKANPEAKAACEAGNWASAYLAIANDSIDVVDDTSWTLADITDKFGLDNSRLVIGTLDAVSATDPLLKAARDALVTTGLRLHTPERQGMITQVAEIGEWDEELTQGIKELGSKTMSRATSVYGRLPTEDEIKIAWEGAIVNQFDKEGILLSINRRHTGKTSLSLVVKEYGETVSGDIVPGEKRTFSYADISKPIDTLSEQRLVNAIQSALEIYLGEV